MVGFHEIESLSFSFFMRYYAFGGRVDVYSKLTYNRKIR